MSTRVESVSTPTFFEPFFCVEFMVRHYKAEIELTFTAIPNFNGLFFGSYRISPRFQGLAKYESHQVRVFLLF